MIKASTRYSVMVRSATDELLYYTKEKPRHVAVEIPATDSLPVGRQVYLEFVPQNGHARGQMMAVPIEAVISVSTNREEV